MFKKMAVAVPPPSHRFNALLFFRWPPKQSAISKDNSKPGALTPRCPLQRLYYVRQKKAIQKRAASVTWPLRAMPAHV